MHDLGYFRAHLDEAAERLAARGFALEVERFRELDARRRAAITEAEQLRAQRNRESAEIAKLRKQGADTSQRQQKVREMAERIAVLEQQAQQLDEEFRQSLAGIPNLPHASVPAGRSEADNVEVRRWGQPRQFEFPPKAHWDLGPELGILDLERAAKVAGARFAVYWNVGAKLERALINFMLDVHTREHGYTEVLPPFMTNSGSLYGTGQLPKFAEDLFKVEGHDFWLAPTAEVPVTNLFRGETLEAERLPIKLCAYTPCFRSEAGSYGRDVRGIIRQHQFQKVELVKFTRPDQSYEELESLTADAEDILWRLGLPHRTVALCAGDLGFSSAKTYDLEVWLPGLGEFKEISSCSNFEAFQARRAGIRMKAGPGKSEFVHTLNGSGLAIGRTWVAVVENCQQADGTPFSGTLFIEWKSFEAVDYSTIATHSLTVPVINGVLRVQLVPTTNATPPATYTVRYSSDGRIQFTEVWAVPPSSTPLKLKDVRVASSTQPGGGEPPPPPGEIEIPDVVGLEEALALRPVKGASYAPSRAAYIGASGALEAVSGNLSDCVRVDGTSGPCGTEGSSAPGFTDAETPAGLINGSNVTFTLAEAPNPSTSLALYRNGLLQRPAADYTLSGNVITFATAATPQPGDLLQAYYRLAGGAAPLTQAGGALTGSYPDPQIAEGVISDFNVAANAGIQESKLALNYPTHLSANDPTADQKAALGGTSGVPSATNRYVTSQDPRMSDARTPAGHPLLGGSHNDTTSGTQARGDLVVAQGMTPSTWQRLPLGPANRCLISNGSDAVWNACLFTGFSPGALPFVDSQGNLAQNAARLTWDNSSRRLAVGNNLGLTTLYVYDAAPGTGVTGLTVRGGQNQGAQPLQSWQTSTGAEVGYVDAGGTLSAVSVRASGSASRGSWQEAGVAADPSARNEGDAWYNTTQQARKAVAAGRVHTLPQVVCASTGGSTSAQTHTRLGSCSFPAGFLKPGDRVEIRFDFSHEGTDVAFTIEVRWGGSPLVRRNATRDVSKVAGRVEAGIHSGGAQWSVLSWGTALALAADVGQASDPLTSPLSIDLLAHMNEVTSETVTLRNFAVVRYPAQANP